MASVLWLTTLAAMLVGLGHMMALRQLTNHMLAKPESVLTLVISTTLMRVVPILLIVLVLVTLGPAPTLVALIGYWVGRNVVLITALPWKNR